MTIGKKCVGDTISVHKGKREKYNLTKFKMQLILYILSSFQLRIEQQQILTVNDIVVCACLLRLPAVIHADYHESSLVSSFCSMAYVRVSNRGKCTHKGDITLP